MFLDADTSMHPGLVGTIVDTLEGKYLAGKSRVFPDEDSFGAKAYFWWVDVCGNLSQAFTHINPAWNNGAGACLFSWRYQLEMLQRKDGHVFREDLKTMEDVELISRLRACGPFKYLRSPGVTTSTRRFKGEGYLKRFFLDFVEYNNPAKISERMDHR